MNMDFVQCRRCGARYLRERGHSLLMCNLVKVSKK